LVEISAEAICRRAQIGFGVFPLAITDLSQPAILQRRQQRQQQ
jgi:hypothetical protein